MKFQDFTAECFCLCFVATWLQQCGNKRNGYSNHDDIPYIWFETSACVESFTANRFNLCDFYAKIKDFFIKFLLFQDKSVLLWTELDNSKRKPLRFIAN